MKGFRGTKSVFTSLAVHAASVALLFFALRHSTRKLTLPELPLLIDVSESPLQPHAVPGFQEGLKSKLKPKKSVQHFQLKDLGVKYGWQVPVGKSERLEQSEENRSHSLDLAEDSKDTPFFRYIYTKVNENLFYPEELKKKMIQGAVNAVLVFTEGQFNEAQTRISSSSAFLKVNVMRALRRALRDKLPDSLHQMDARIEVSCRFIFHIVEHTDEGTEAALNRVVGTEITFYRSWVHSVVQWDIGPLHGFGPSVGLNLKWFYDKVEDMVSKKAKFDPLDSYRDDPAW